MQHYLLFGEARLLVSEWLRVGSQQKVEQLRLTFLLPAGHDGVVVEQLAWPPDHITWRKVKSDKTSLMNHHDHITQ